MRLLSMTPVDSARNVPLVWCPIIPLDKIDELSDYEEELRTLADVYDDWAASMRGKPITGGEVGIYLDRIRILMFRVGVASGTNREFAEKAQSIISDELRKQAMRSVKAIWEDSKSKRVMKNILNNFFSDIRFTRDIDPVEEMEKAVTKSLKSKSTKVLGSKRKDLARRTEKKSSVDVKSVRAILVEATRIVLRIYMKLLSPDPWSLD